MESHNRTIAQMKNAQSCDYGAKLMQLQSNEQSLAKECETISRRLNQLKKQITNVTDETRREQTSHAFYF